MKSRAEVPFNWHVRRFSFYRPPNRLSRGMVTAAPWVDAALLIVMVLLLNSRFVLQPGITVNLPVAPFAAGTRYGHVVVVLYQEAAGRASDEEIAFFEDERFVLSREGQYAKLAEAFAAATRREPESPMVIEADRRVSHGTLVALLRAAADAGLREVNVATRPSPQEARRP